MKKLYYVTDTSSLIRLLRSNEFTRLVSTAYVAIPEDVLGEIKDKESRFLLESFLERISIINPPTNIINFIIKRAHEIGSIAEISKVDISIIALAYYLKEKKYDVIVLTEDFAIQNLCSVLGIAFSSVRPRKIKWVFKIKKKCNVCGEVFDVLLDECPICGSKNYKLIKKRTRKIS